MDKPKYRDKDWLHRQYVERGRSITDIADELGVDHTTISKWRRKLDIPKPSAKVTLECPVCGDEFTRSKSRIERAKHASVCSRDCHYQGRSEGIIKREVEGGYKHSHYAGESNGQARVGAEENTVEIDCRFCGDSFQAPESQDRVYCSRQCYEQSRNRQQATCSKCGDKFTHPSSDDRKYCSRTCFESVHSKRMAGENNPAYKDGSAADKRCHRGPHWSRIRRRVYERDEYTCQRCGVKCISRGDYDGTNGERIIQAHHINGYESPEDNDLSELVTLCASCHGAVEGGASLDVAPDELDSDG